MEALIEFKESSLSVRRSVHPAPQGLYRVLFKFAKVFFRPVSDLLVIAREMAYLAIIEFRPIGSAAHHKVPQPYPSYPEHR